MLSLYNSCCNFAFVLFVCYVIISVLMVWICFGTKKHEVRFQKRSIVGYKWSKTLSLLPQTQLVKAYRCWAAVSSGGLVFGSRFARLSHTFQSTLTEPQSLSLNVLAEPNLSGKDSTILCVAKVVYIAEFTGWTAWKMHGWHCRFYCTRYILLHMFPNVSTKCDWKVKIFLMLLVVHTLFNSEQLLMFHMTHSLWCWL